MSTNIFKFIFTGVTRPSRCFHSNNTQIYTPALNASIFERLDFSFTNYPASSLCIFVGAEMISMATPTYVIKALEISFSPDFALATALAKASSMNNVFKYFEIFFS